ncbi:MAG: PEP-CTERM sorting domain-containing protein [Bryobacteraceae bacterium]
MGKTWSNIRRASSFLDGNRVLLALMGLAAQAARGDSLLPSMAEETLLNSPELYVRVNTPGCISAPSVGTACASFGSDPSVSATSSFGSAGALVFYSFEIVGSGNQEAVPVIISGTATFSASYLSFADGKIGLGTFNDNFLTTFWQFNSGSPSPGAFQLHESLPSSNQLDLDLEVGCGGDPGACSVSIDPTITIDPSFPDAAKFSIIEDTGSNSAAPEPATLLLIGAGLCCLGARRRWLRQ